MRQLFSSLMCVGLVACAGDAPPDPNNGADAGVDAPAIATAEMVSGKVMDYFTANTPVSATTVTSEGVDPVMTATSGTDGSYSLADVPIGSKVVFTTTHAAYRPTRNVPTTVADMAVTQDLYQIAKADVDRQYVAANPAANPPITATLGTGVLFVELDRNNGMPLDAIPLTDIALLNAAGLAVPGVIGPYVFGALGDLDPTLTTATIFAARSRIGILDVPPGTYTLQVTYPNAQGVPMTMQLSVTTIADGATLAVTGGTGGDGGGNPPPPTPSFATDIYPRLQRASAGGLGCASCHTLGGPAGNVLKYDDPEPLVFTNVTTLAGVVNLTTPATSLFLTMPLYEPPPYNHPNATFLDVSDPDYKLFLAWITAGARP